MTEDEWNSCTDPQRMLEFLRDTGRATDRRCRLFACACVRQVWARVKVSGRQAVQVAEQCADGQVALKALRVARAAASASLHGAARAAMATTREPAFAAAREAQREVIQTAKKTDRGAWQTVWAVKAAAYREQADLLRDIFGPLRKVRIDPMWLAWNDGSVVKLAEAAYENREMPGGALDNARLGVLADALEDGGCDDEEVLAHLRQQGKLHVRGCYVVDLLLNKE
jgi:hypothetical protein